MSAPETPGFVCVEGSRQDTAFIVSKAVVDVFRRHVTPTQADLDEVTRMLKANPRLAVRIVGIGIVDAPK